MKEMKKILIISPYFAPENVVASIRFSKIAKYLIKDGYDVTVICTQMNARLLIDKSLEKDLPLYRNLKRINYPEKLYYKVKGKMGTENSVKQPGKQKGHIKESKFKDALILLYVHLCDRILACRYIKEIVDSREKYDIVITTFNPLAAHIAGKYLKKRGICKLWIADFRDPLSALHEKTAVNLLLQRYGIRLVKTADWITTVSKGIRQKLLLEAGRYSDEYSSKLKVISNGFDEEDRVVVKGVVPAKEKLIFTYCGTIYKFKGKIQTCVAPLFAAISQLEKEKKIETQNIEIRYAGTTEDLFLEVASQYQMQKIVQSVGRISRDQALKLQSASDIIVVAIWNNVGDEGVLTGKFFESLLVERNVLCIVKGDKKESELTQIVRTLNCGFSYEEINGGCEEFEQLKSWICDMYKQKFEQGKVQYNICRDNNLFSHAALAREYEALFEMSKD